MTTFNQDSHDYDMNWAAFNASATAPTTDMQSVYNAFQHTDALKIWSFPINGPYTTYLGGGFVYKMTGNLNETLTDYALLAANNWIDRNTRAVFVEFSVYNPNIEMFAYCNLLFEIMPTGSIFTSYRFSPVTIFDSSQDLLSFGTICALIYLVLVFLLSFRQIFAIKTMGKKYFKELWSYMDLSQIAFSFAAFAIWLYRLWEAQRVMNQMASYLTTSTDRTGKYVNLQMLAYWDDTLSCLLAICACLGSLKFLKILQFNSTIRTLFSTMNKCVHELVSFGLIFILAVFAFIQAGYVVFNDRIYGLSTFFKSIETGFLLMLGKFQLKDMLNANPTCTVIFYMAFNVFVIMVLLNMFISMMCDAFEEAKEEAKSGDPLGLEAYLYDKLAKFFGSVKEKSSLVSASQKEKLSREERDMMASVSQQGNYMATTDQFNYKANLLVNVLHSVIKNT
jgi:hypothetical protein